MCQTDLSPAVGEEEHGGPIGARWREEPRGSPVASSASITRRKEMASLLGRLLGGWSGRRPP